MRQDPQHIILFDGVCNLCNGGVQFVIKRDKKKKFLFASLQSDYGQSVLKDLGCSTDDFDSFLYLKQETVFTKSDAALHVLKELGGFYKLLYVFIIVPKVLRDSVYSFIAQNRYNWFGKQTSCWLPTEELSSRFL